MFAYSSDVPSDGVTQVDRGAAELVAGGRVGRLPDALIGATALRFDLPLITGSRRLARSSIPNAFLVADYR